MCSGRANVISEMYIDAAHFAIFLYLSRRQLYKINASNKVALSDMEEYAQRHVKIPREIELSAAKRVLRQRGRRERSDVQRDFDSPHLSGWLRHARPAGGHGPGLCPRCGLGQHVEGLCQGLDTFRALVSDEGCR